MGPSSTLYYQPFEFIAHVPAHLQLIPEDLDVRLVVGVGPDRVEGRLAPLGVAQPVQDGLEALLEHVDLLQRDGT